jgi:signal transduction histidine kinase/DNA-binding NarL/FixJ family response regulator
VNASRPIHLASIGIACFLLSSCSNRLEYRGEIGRGILPADESAAPLVCLAPIERSSRLYVRFPFRDGDPTARGQVVSFSLPDGALLGTFRDDRGREDRTLRIAATAGGDLAVLRWPESAVLGAAKGGAEYELSAYGPDERPLGRSLLASPFPRDSAGAPFAVGVAAAESGDAAVAWADPAERETGGVSLYRSALSAAGPRAAAPSLTVSLESFRSKLPLSAAGGLRATSLCYRDGFYYVAIEMASESFDGILVLDRDLDFVRYIGGEWAFNCPSGVAVDASGRMYASNRWEDNIVAYRGDRLLAKSAKDYLYGSEGFLMNGPGAVAAAGDELYAYDSANGRILRFSTVMPGRSEDRAIAERTLRPIIARYASDGGFDSWLIPFMLGCLAILSIHGFVVGATSREREFAFLGLINLCAFAFFIERSYSRFFVDLGEWDIAMGLYIGAIILFTRDYISRAGKRKWIMRTLGALGLIALAASAISALRLIFLGAEAVAPGVRMSNFPSIAAILLIMGILVLESARRNREARIALALNLVLFASGILSIGIFDYSAFEGTFLEHILAQGYPLMLGCLLNSLILSLDLGSNLGAVKAERERKELENRSLRELDRQKTDFIMNVSHELRTPLSVILGVADRAGTGGRAAQVSGDELEMIRRNAMKLRRDIDNLLTLSCLERRSSFAEASTVSLAPFLRMLAAELQSLAESRGLSLVLTPPDEGLRVRADRELLETAVLNLVTNAIKFTPPGGRVAIGARADGSGAFARIEVSDTGIGVRPELREKIFQRFFRADEGERRRYEGAGIGLALVREVAELHGGRAEVESETGKGSTFTLAIPIEAAPARDEGRGPAEGRCHEADSRGAPTRHEAESCAAAEPGAEAGQALEIARRPGAARPPRETVGSVLVAEDNDDLRSALASILSERFFVRTAADGSEALRALEESVPDCVVSDIMMPGMDGYDLFRAIREGPRGGDLPFVFLTARADPEERERALRDGALDYIEKPFSPAELVAKVENLVALRKGVSARVKASLKDSIARLIDGLDEEARPSGAEAAGRAAPLDYEALFRDKGLSEREAQIARLILGGSSDKEIAYGLGISASTVANHNNKLYRKLGISSRLELLAMGSRERGRGAP